MHKTVRWHDGMTASASVTHPAEITTKNAHNITAVIHNGSLSEVLKKTYIYDYSTFYRSTALICPQKNACSDVSFEGHFVPGSMRPNGHVCLVFTKLII